MPLLEQLQQRKQEITEEDNLQLIIENQKLQKDISEVTTKQELEKSLNRRKFFWRTGSIFLGGIGIGTGATLGYKVIDQTHKPYESYNFQTNPSGENDTVSIQVDNDSTTPLREIPTYAPEGFRVPLASSELKNYFGSSSGSVVIENMGVTINPSSRVDFDSTSNQRVGNLRYSKRTVHEIENPNGEINLEMLALPLGDVYLIFKNPVDTLASQPIPLDINTEQELRGYTDSLTHSDKDAIDVIVDKRLTSGDGVLQDLAGEASIFNYAKAGIKTVVVAENVSDLDITFDDGKSGILLDRNLAEKINSQSNDGLIALGHKASTFILQKNRSDLNVSSAIDDLDTLFVEIKNNFQKRTENLEIYGVNGSQSEYNVVSIFNMFSGLNIVTTFPDIDDLFADVVTTLRYNPVQFLDSYSNKDETKGIVLTDEERKRVNQILDHTFDIMTKLTGNKGDKSLAVIFPEIQQIRTATGNMSDEQEEDLQDFLNPD